MKKRNKKYKMLLGFESIIKGVEKDIKKNKNLSPIFHSEKDICEYLDNKKINYSNTESKQN